MVEEEPFSNETNGNGEIHNENNSSNSFKELDPELEKKLCDLWDITVEKDVCTCLDEYNAMQIFEGFMRKFDGIYPRAIEILIGILANMTMMSSKTGLKLSENNSLLHYLLFNVLCQMNDVQTMIQVMRLFTTFLTDWNECSDNQEEGIMEAESQNENSQRKLIKAKFLNFFKSELISPNDASPNWQALVEKFFFILEQSLNATLLDSTISYLFNLLDNDDQILDFFAGNSRLVDAICMASLTRLRLDNADKSFIASQYSQTNQDALQTPIVARAADGQPSVPYRSQFSQDDILTTDHIFNKFFLCLQTLSTCELGAASLLASCDCVFQLYDEYLERCLSTFNDWEIKSSHSLKSSVGQESIQNLLCVLSVLNCIFPDRCQAESQLRQLHLKYPKFFQKFFTLCNYYLNLFNELVNKSKKRTSPSTSAVEQEDASNMNNFKLAQTFMKDLFANLEELKQDNDSNLNRIFVNCSRLLNEQI